MDIISGNQFMKTAQVFHWATVEQYVMWFTGGTERWGRAEVILPRLVSQGKLRAVMFGKKLAYSSLRRSRGKHFNIYHGLACTEGLVRIWRSDMTGEIIPERYCRGRGVVPEWGIRYGNGRVLLFEFCTRDNFERYNLVQGKMARYRKIFPDAVVLFVIDHDRRKVQEFVGKMTDAHQFYFVDFETFKNVPIGGQLEAPIYFWGGNSDVYPLRPRPAHEDPVWQTTPDKSLGEFG